MSSYEFTAPLWQWEAKSSAWTFVTVPDDVADEVDEVYSGPARGFGAVKVRVTIGSSTWDTSMFPSKEHQSYVLPIKASVRKSEGIDEGDSPKIRIELIAA